MITTNKDLINRIMKKYKDNEEPGTHKNDEQLKSKKVAGAPTSNERSSIRKQCNVKGPVGYLLESMHRNAATVDTDFIIRQYDQSTS